MINSNINNHQDQQYLVPTQFMDFESDEVQDFITSTIHGCKTTHEKIIKLYYAVRDSIRYDTYGIVFEPNHFRASATLKAKRGFCVQKSLLFAATARAIGVPSRLGYADVRNHISTEKIRKVMRSDIFVFHGYVDLYLDNQWVKATPVFNKSLCEKLNVRSLDFDGTKDSLFQEYDRRGKKSMEYIRFHGTYADLPYQEMTEIFRKTYPHLYKEEI